MGASLYETDFVRWSEEQADAIRRAASTGADLPLDWENLAVEIESLGRSQRTELANRLVTVVEHLLKLECSPADRPRGGWRTTVSRTRAEIDRLLRDSPSLRPLLPVLLTDIQPSTAAYTADGIRLHGEDPAPIGRRLAAGGYSIEQVLDAWFPGEEA
jgi:hypothetical protein